MRQRLSRAVQVEKNREDVLAAARRVFLERGYAGATLEAIAEEAGFSKGVVYSQFDGKADLFLALLERRIVERAEENDRIAAETAGAAGVSALLRVAEHAFVGEPAWSLLMAEFRAHAARDPELHRRYADLHEQTIQRLAEAVGKIHERAGLEPRLPTRTIAELILALGIGVELERIANPEALPMDVLAPALARTLGLEPAESGRRLSARRIETRTIRR